MKSRRWSLALAVLTIGSLLLGACVAPTPQVIEKEVLVEVTKIVEKERERQWWRK
jgi:hypothetical protein